MATSLRVGFVTGSGAVLDQQSSVSLADTRVRAIQASGVGTFLITGVSTDEHDTVKGNNIKFVLTTANDTAYLDFTDNGIKMDSTIKVSAPTSAATTTVFYG